MSTTGRPYWEWNSSYPDSGKRFCNSGCEYLSRFWKHLPCLGFRVAGFSGKIINVNTEKKRLRVGVLFGGRSGEHEVSLASAAAVIRGMDPDKYEAVPIGITKEGHWLVGVGAQKMLPEVLKGGQRVMMTADFSR